MGKTFLLAVIVIALAFAAAESIPFTEKDLETEKSLWSLYGRWGSFHTQSRNLNEKRRRFNVFKQNVKYIHESNKKSRPYKLALNKFADMTNDEFRQTYSGPKIARDWMLHSGNKNNTGFMYEDVDDVPSSMDWREQGAVTLIKNQGKCGSCWAFSTIVAVEGINQIRTGELISLTEQELVDCDNTDNKGCNGGLMDKAFNFIQSNGGITTESNYPYFAKQMKCNTKKENSHAVTIDGYEDVPANNEDALLKAVANQPVSVSIEASGKDFQFYSQGVFTGECGTELDHGVAIVGYGSAEDGIKYWIVRNSWGGDWGENGYIRMQRGVSAQGLCGIAMDASYPIKNSPNADLKKKLNRKSML